MGLIKKYSVTVNGAEVVVEDIDRCWASYRALMLFRKDDQIGETTCLRITRVE